MALSRDFTLPNSRSFIRTSPHHPASSPCFVSRLRNAWRYRNLWSPVGGGDRSSCVGSSQHLLSYPADSDHKRFSGIVDVQCFAYFKFYPSDSPRIKVLVGPFLFFLRLHCRLRKLNCRSRQFGLLPLPVHSLSTSLNIIKATQFLSHHLRLNITLVLFHYILWGAVQNSRYSLVRIYTRPFWDGAPLIILVFIRSLAVNSTTSYYTITIISWYFLSLPLRSRYVLIPNPPLSKLIHSPGSPHVPRSLVHHILPYPHEFVLTPYSFYVHRIYKSESLHSHFF